MKISFLEKIPFINILKNKILSFIFKIFVTDLKAEKVRKLMENQLAKRGMMT